MPGGMMPMQKPRHRGWGILLSVVLMAAGVLLLVFATQVTNFVGTIIGQNTLANATGAAGGSQIAAVSPLALYGPFAVYAVALALIGLGARRIRMTLMTAGMSSGPSMPAVSMPPMAAEMMANATALQAGTAAAAKPVVKVKCKGCGFLEREDATYCSKCGQAL